MNNNQFIALLYGWIVVLGLMLLSSLILATFLRFTSFNDPSLSWMTLLIGIISLFIGGFVAGLKSKQKGWLIGCLTGSGFVLLVFLVQYLGYNHSLSSTQLLHHSSFIIAAMIGGMIGVNLFSKEQS